jgi:biotin carboxylase
VDRLQREHNVRFAWVEAFSDFWLELESRLRAHLGLSYTMSGAEFERKLLKSGSKRFYAEAGVPAADYIVTQDGKAVREFAARVGFPVIAKPDRGSGASETYKIDDTAALEQFVGGHHLEATPFIIEEFIRGDLVSYDGLCDLDGNIVFSSVGLFRVPCLDLATSTNVDCAAAVLHKSDPDVDKAGRACAKSFGIRGRFFHMEFFVRHSDKKVMGLEVNMRAQPLFFPIWDIVYSIDPVVLYVNMLLVKPSTVPPPPPVPQNALFFSRRSRHNYRMSHRDILADSCTFSYTPLTESQLVGDHLYYISHSDVNTMYDRLLAFLKRA